MAKIVLKVPGREMLCVLGDKELPEGNRYVLPILPDLDFSAETARPPIFERPHLCRSVALPIERCFLWGNAVRVHWGPETYEWPKPIVERCIVLTVELLEKLGSSVHYLVNERAVPN